MQKLSQYDNSHYYPGAGNIKRFVWYCVNAILFDSWLLPSSRVKVFILRIFGARMGNAVTIKPKVNIKYPWYLDVGNNVWIGEGVWVDNYANIVIKDDVCISQGVYLLTGNHNYKNETFDLMVKGITIESGVWIGAKVIICPGVHVLDNAVITVGCIVSSDTESNSVYKCDHAVFFKHRISAR